MRKSKTIKLVLLSSLCVVSGCEDSSRVIISPPPDQEDSARIIYTAENKCNEDWGNECIAENYEDDDGNYHPTGVYYSPYMYNTGVGNYYLNSSGNATPVPPKIIPNTNFPIGDSIATKYGPANTQMGLKASPTGYGRATMVVGSPVTTGGFGRAAAGHGVSS